MTKPMPDVKTYVLQNQGGTAGTMKPTNRSVYIPLTLGINNCVLSWAGGYDIEVVYAPSGTTSGAYVVASFTGQVQSQTEALDITKDNSTATFYVRSRNTSSGNVDKPLGLMVTSWPI